MKSDFKIVKLLDEEHRKILLQGTKVWNQWKEANTEIVPSLLGIIFKSANLRKIDFRRTDLNGVVFSGSDLREADLSMANLSGAYLMNANLEKADLTGARLYCTSLDGASLRGANLRAADLTSAHLIGADFSNAIAGHTSFSDKDLSVVKGLDTVQHEAPSTIGIDTLYKSKGKIPESFLRGCGLTNEFIIYIQSLVTANRPIQFHSSFISYSNNDEEFAQRLYADLQKRGVRCWFAPKDMKIGERFRVRIDEAIRVHDKVLLVLSKHSVSSQWVEKEVETALEREVEQNSTMLFPVRLDNAVMEIKTGWPADIRRSRHIGDFRNWKNPESYQEAFDRLLHDLKAEISGDDDISEKELILELIRNKYI